MDEKQFNDAFTTAGGWFIADYFLLAKMWKRSNTELAEVIYYNDKTDSDISGTKARVNALMRIIKGEKEKEALMKICHSDKIAKEHPESIVIAANILKSMKYTDL